MRDTDQQIEHGLHDMPEIPFPEGLRRRILESAHDLTADPKHGVAGRRKRWKSWKPFAASFAGVAVAAVIVTGVLQQETMRGNPTATTATIPATEVGLKPAQVTVTNIHYNTDKHGKPMVYATVQNDSNHDINKFDTFSVLWLGGTADNALSGDSLMIANGPGKSIHQSPPDDDAPLPPGEKVQWHFEIDVPNANQYVKKDKDKIHLHFFQAGVSGTHMTKPVVTWTKAPLKATYSSRSVLKKTKDYQSIQYNYQITNTGTTNIDLRNVWGIDWFNNPGMTNQNWDDENVTRYADIPHLNPQANPILAPGAKRDVYFKWTIPNSIESITTEQPNVFFVEK